MALWKLYTEGRLGFANFLITSRNFNRKIICNQSFSIIKLRRTFTSSRLWLLHRLEKFDINDDKKLYGEIWSVLSEEKWYCWIYGLTVPRNDNFPQVPNSRQFKDQHKHKIQPHINLKPHASTTTIFIISNIICSDNFMQY